MYENETVSSVGEDQERFMTAFYRFLETHPIPVDEAVWIRAGRHSAPAEAVFSTEGSAKRFRNFLAAFKLHREEPLRFSRFDDLRC